MRSDPENIKELLADIDNLWPTPAECEKMVGLLQDMQVRLRYLVLSDPGGIISADHEFAWEANMREIKRLIADLKIRIQELTELLSCLQNRRT